MDRVLNKERIELLEERLIWWPPVSLEPVYYEDDTGEVYNVLYEIEREDPGADDPTRPPGPLDKINGILNAPGSVLKKRRKRWKMAYNTVRRKRKRPVSKKVKGEEVDEHLAEGPVLDDAAEAGPSTSGGKGRLINVEVKSEDAGQLPLSQDDDEASNFSLTSSSEEDDDDFGSDDASSESDGNDLEDTPFSLKNGLKDDDEDDDEDDFELDEEEDEEEEEDWTPGEGRRRKRRSSTRRTVTTGKKRKRRRIRRGLVGSSKKRRRSSAAALDRLRRATRRLDFEGGVEGAEATTSTTSNENSCDTFATALQEHNGISAAVPTTSGEAGPEKTTPSTSTITSPGTSSSPPKTVPKIRIKAITPSNVISSDRKSKKRRGSGSGSPSRKRLRKKAKTVKTEVENVDQLLLNGDKEVMRGKAINGTLSATLNGCGHSSEDDNFVDSVDVYVENSSRALLKDEHHLQPHHSHSNSKKMSIEVHQEDVPLAASSTSASAASTTSSSSSPSSPSSSAAPFDEDGGHSVLSSDVHSPSLDASQGGGDQSSQEVNVSSPSPVVKDPLGLHLHHQTPLLTNGDL